jgi:cytosine/adenosine deaminase-related metal-dependent hydrolase
MTDGPATGELVHDDGGTPDPETLLIENGFVYTADRQDRVYPSGSVLIVDGSIAAVGDAADVHRAVDELRPALGSAPRTIDARHNLVLPGFVNAHWHDMFAARIAFGGALRSCHDHGDQPGFLARGGEMHTISALFDRVSDMIEALTPAEAEAIAYYSVWTQLRSGTTTIGDVGSLNRPEALIAAVRGLGIRGAISTWASDVVCECGSDHPRRTRDSDRLLSDLEGVYRSCASDPTERVRARPSAVYVTNMSDELGAGLAQIVERFGSTFATHLGAQRNEAAFVEHYFGARPVERLDRLGLVSDRLMAVHCSFVNDDETRRLVDAGVHINHSPAKYGAAGESTMSETRLISKLLRDGADVSLSTDGTILPLGGMVENMRAAWEMHNEMWADQTVVVPSNALAMATRHAARGLGWDDEVGSLEVGKQGDLVMVPIDDWRYLLNPRPLEGLLRLGSSNDVKTVIVGGQVLLRESRACVVDEAELVTEFLAALRSFSARLPGADPARIDAVMAHAAGGGS